MQERPACLVDQSGDIAGCCLLWMQYGDDGIGCEREAAKIKEMKNTAFRF